MGVTVQQDGDTYYYGDHAIGARIGTFGETKQPVVFVSVGKECKMVLGYDTLCRVIDMLCGKKELLEEKMFAKMELITVGKPKKEKK